MQNVLDKVDFEKYTLYNIQIKVIDTYGFEELLEGEKTEDEHGQSLDVVSDIRRTIKYSFPFESKKFILSINPEDEKPDQNGDMCRNIEMEYYLPVATENIDEFSIEELHDELEEEWRNGGASCEINISLYER